MAQSAGVVALVDVVVLRLAFQCIHNHPGASIGISVYPQPPRQAAPATPPQRGIVWGFAGRGDLFGTTPSGCACHPSAGGECEAPTFPRSRKIPLCGGVARSAGVVLKQPKCLSKLTVVLKQPKCPNEAPNWFQPNPTAQSKSAGGFISLKPHSLLTKALHQPGFF